MVLVLCTSDSCSISMYELSCSSLNTVDKPNTEKKKRKTKNGYEF